MSDPDYPIIDAQVHTYRSREVGRQAMMGRGQTDYGVASLGASAQCGARAHRRPEIVGLRMARLRVLFAGHGWREAWLQDPDGYVWAVGSAI